MSALDKALTPLGRLLRNRRAGEEHSIRRAPALASANPIDFSTPAFADGQPIPGRHTGSGRGPNLSPALHWGPLPDGTRQLLLVMEDIDVPLKRPIIHLAALFPPEIEGFDEGALSPGNTQVRYVPAALRRTGYQGPGALPGHGVHRYGFHLYALDEPVPATTPVPNLSALLPLVAGHVLAAGFFEGTQQN
ncbi:YbhB/YbcL family Raf kinase inhibitor-like protein [Streptomyces beijiangensis]|uniref:YbhB/YbcL family Raf kinase inhibitor-like protein n=1 Tax=Streptomyces beijiangensis TaxID=163361 RepID=A0A939FDN1_9ACTN|nr:YbhB/YbcL family Raf kinase inhibitor-like protein [Streptomyces beijiangensis]MBO0516718.1 YbhB/YbcL family Raf kinase inhibitor-like protein [Streptomyces beijiangensis]